MKKFSVLSLILGAIVTIFGILPFLFAYPYNDSPNSGPSNMWRLLLIHSYDGKVWYLFAGITLILLWWKTSTYKAHSRSNV